MSQRCLFSAILGLLMSWITVHETWSQTLCSGPYHIDNRRDSVQAMLQRFDIDLDQLGHVSDLLREIANEDFPMAEGTASLNPASWRQIMRDNPSPYSVIRDLYRDLRTRVRGEFPPTPASENDVPGITTVSPPTVFPASNNGDKRGAVFVIERAGKFPCKMVVTYTGQLLERYRPPKWRWSIREVNCQC